MGIPHLLCIYTDMTNKELKIEFSNLLARIKQTDFLKSDKILRRQYIYALRDLIRLLNNQISIDLSYWINIQVRLKAYIEIYQKEKIIDEIGIRELLTLILNGLDEYKLVGFNSSSFYEDEVKKLTEDIKEKSQEVNTYVDTVYDINNKSNEVQNLRLELDRLRKQLEIEKNNNLDRSTTSLHYYAELVKAQNKLNEKEKELREALEKKKELEVTRRELTEQQKLVAQYKAEQQKAKEKESAIENWKVKIKTAFGVLNDPINKLVDEHKRLEWLYNVYKWSSTVLVFFLIIIEIVVYVKIVCSDTYPTWDQYLPMALPVPITLGLLWGFITQMNRAQRQMVVLSNKIHEIKYTEGLLQALNTLSVDIGESMSKINDAISHLIDNHLRNMDSMRLDEKDLSKIEKQNALPIEQIPELIKLINKSKE